MEPNIASVANLIGDPTRAKMLAELMGGKALTATELAMSAEVTSQTASSHLRKLVNAQLLVVRKQGRHKYFQLRGQEVAMTIEGLLNLSANIDSTAISGSKPSTGPKDPSLKQARICYDHLAGEVGVALYDALQNNCYITEKSNCVTLTEEGASFFQRIGVELGKFSSSKRPICRPCLDWSERRSHLAGSLGQWILDDIFAHDWARKDLNSRAITFSTIGLKKMAKRYQISESFKIKN